MCRLLNLARSSARYAAHPRDDQPLKAKLEQLRQKHPRFGVPRVHALLNQQQEQAGAQRINRKRVERVWRRYEMQVPLRPKKRKVKTERPVPCQAERPDHVWSYDFQEDGLLSGRKIRLLNIMV